MKKYERFILGLLAFVCLILQVTFGISLAIMFINALFSGSRQELSQVLLSSMEITHSPLSSTFIIFYVVVFSVVSVILMISYLNCIRNLLQNINEDIYFEERNLNLIKKTFIYYGAATLLDISGSIINNLYHINLLNQGPSNNIFYLPKGALMVLGIYVIYMVFKQGIRLKKESDAFV
ncbi:DUF2975 domain-containing protein [Enterococcus pallens]|uniref:DUF2975 domain-containing protein n=1 Tax=Enterococcus pallens ATCC BAA-351 TaxID=1158607 RepID=R2QE29_9ENTE|nr:DUF2975 domain-containing protein [Enterococcus pallens]EOH94742.1 hypothetical protein UAU_01664 [Enterococcus pallens ATCC BAA-351]EOU14939.1 hypothetical protein I588_04589 [Enterococcus pallens ATCC BAA-351]OJG78198.1 hypothetical protein RV10_GL001686 [Enterococcus pallens]